MNNNKKTNGTLNSHTEALRMEVVELELKARFWRAQFEIRDFTLKAEEIKESYMQYVQDQEKIQEEQMAKLQALVDSSGELDIKAINEEKPK